MSDTTDKFPDIIILAARSAHAKYGIFASVQLAQWALESAFGAHEPKGSNNPFGIKAVAGQPRVTAYTHEFEKGRYIGIAQNFAAYSTVCEAFDAHASLLAHSHFYVKALHASNPNAFAQDLTGIYATDPQYGSKLVALMSHFDLYQFDA